MLDGGSVVTVLSGRFVPTAHLEFTVANDKAAQAAERAEARITAATNTAAKAQERAAAAAARASAVTRAANDAAASSAEKTAAKQVAANDTVAASSRRMSGAIPLKAMNLWDTQAKKASDSLSKIGQAAKTGAVVGLLAVGAATAYAVVKTVSFNREMLKVQTQANASASEMRSLSREVLALAGHVPQGPQKLAEGLYHIQSAGYRGAQSLQILEAAAKGAALGNTNLEDTANAVVGAMASQIKGAENAAGTMGTLNATVGIGNMRFQELDQSIGTQILPTFAQAGLTLTDFGAALATVTDNSVPANVTATRLRMTIAQIVSPTKAAAKELEKVGLSSTSLAVDLHKPNGLLVAVQDLRNHLRDSGKTAIEQDQILSNSFGRGKSSAVIMTLVKEIERLESKYQQLGKTDGVKRLAESWAAFQKSEAAGLGELKSGAEGFAIAVGTMVMPELTKLASGAASAFGDFVKNGGAAKAGQDLASGFKVVGQVISGLAPDVAALAKALYDLGAAGSSVGHFFGLGLAGQIETAAAAFVAFKAATTILPIVAAGIGAVSQAAFIGTAAIEDYGLSFAALGAVAEFINPMTAIVGAITIAAAAFVALKAGLFSSESAAEKNASAMQHDAEAIKNLNDATNEAAKAHFAAERAALNHKEAVEALKRTEKEVHDGTLKGVAAENALLNNHLRTKEALNELTEARQKASVAVEKQTAVAQKSIETGEATQRETLNDIKNVFDLIGRLEKQGATEQVLAAPKQKLIELQREYNKEAEAAAQHVAETEVAEESLNRIQAGRRAITPPNAIGVNDLKNALAEADAPKKIVTRYELEDQNAQAKLGTLSAQLEKLGHTKVVSKILTTAPNASVAIEAMNAVLHGVPGSKVIQIMAHSASAEEAIIALKAVIAGVPPSKVIQILTTAPSAKTGVEDLKASIAALENRSISITTVMTTISKTIGETTKKLLKFASGRAPGDREAAVVGEGQAPEYVVNSRTGAATVVSKPTLMGLGPDEYVIPLEDRYRGRALGLFMQLAKDLEIPGYKSGRAPHKKTHGGNHWAVPDAIAPLSLPLSEIEQRQQEAKSTATKAASQVKSDTSKIKSLEGHVRAAERNLRYASSKGTAKAKDRDRLRELKGELAKARETHGRDEHAYHGDEAKVKEWARTVKEAKAYQTRINERTSEVNNAANEMKLAAGRDDRAAYDAAKSHRLSLLGQLKGLLQHARQYVKDGSEYALQLQGQIQNTELEEQSTGHEEFKAEGNKEAEQEEQTGMTSGEVTQLKAIEKSIALASLTSGLEDDKTAATSLVSFLEGVLGEAIAEPQARGGDDTITSIADQLKTARSNLESLTGSGSNSNSDLQAQIDQANKRVEVAEREAQIANQALSVFGGPGDIGAGGGNAAQAAAGVVNHFEINTLHPADPATLTAIGRAATAGIGYQGARQTVRQKMGPLG